MRRAALIAGIVTVALAALPATAEASVPRVITIPAPAPAPAPAPQPAGAATSAAVLHNWGTPIRVDDFSKDLSGWSLYNGPGHAGNGRRSPSAAKVANGMLTITGSPSGTTEGMAWNPGQRYGRWEGRVRAPASDPSYNALLLLWPDAENFPVGGEIDFMEMSDHTRQETETFLHYSASNKQVQGKVRIDATQWHNWAVEWTPQKVTTYVDGKEWWSTTQSSILPPGPMHLCIQLDWFPKNGTGTVKQSSMQVDWVRQYAVPETVPGSEGGLVGGVTGGLGDVLSPPSGGDGSDPSTPTTTTPPAPPSTAPTTPPPTTTPPSSTPPATAPSATAPSATAPPATATAPPATASTSRATRPTA